jgi:hypothetical protein
MKDISVNYIPLSILDKRVVGLAFDIYLDNGTFRNAFYAPAQFQGVKIEGNRFSGSSVQHCRNTAAPPNSAGFRRACRFPAPGG